MIFLVIALTFLWGVGSLYLVAIKTASVKTIFLKKPSIIIGDFFILPAIVGIIANSTRNLNDLFNSFFSFLFLLVGLSLTTISALRNKMVHPLWIPHLGFYWVMTFLVLNYISSFKLDLSWWLVLTGATVHQALGMIFPKKFPQIKNAKI